MWNNNNFIYSTVNHHNMQLKNILYYKDPHYIHEFKIKRIQAKLYKLEHVQVYN